ncbi:MAG: NfeD family protein [Planctomycetota bacterium]
MSGDAMLYWGLALIAAAVLLLIVEAFVPSGGLIAAVAAVGAVAGVVFLFRVSVSWGVIGLLLVMVLGPTSFFFALNMLPQTPMGRALLGAPSEEEEMARELAESKEEADRAALVGQEAITLTDLRPVGEIRIDGQRYEATAISGLVDAGSRVRVVKVDSSHIRVKPIA